MRCDARDGVRCGARDAAATADGWAAEEKDYETLAGRYFEALAAAGRSRDDVRIVVGFGGGRSGVDALTDSPWIEAPAEPAARWAAAGADEVTLTARTTADVDRLVEIAGR